MGGAGRDCDIRELQDVITSRAQWKRFASRFDSSGNLAMRFAQLAELRDSIRHGRSVDNVTRKRRGSVALDSGRARRPPGLSRAPRRSGLDPFSLPRRRWPRRREWVTGAPAGPIASRRSALLRCPASADPRRSRFPFLGASRRDAVERATERTAGSPVTQPCPHSQLRA